MFDMDIKRPRKAINFDHAKTGRWATEYSTNMVQYAPPRRKPFAPQPPADGLLAAKANNASLFAPRPPRVVPPFPGWRPELTRPERNAPVAYETESTLEFTNPVDKHQIFRRPVGGRGVQQEDVHLSPRQKHDKYVQEWIRMSEQTKSRMVSNCQRSYQPWNLKDNVRMQDGSDYYTL